MPKQKTEAEKSKLSVLQYAKRIGKSIGFAAVETLHEQMPVTFSTIANNKEVAKQLYQDTFGSSRQHLNKIQQLQDNLLFKPANTLLKNIKKDIKSGNFYDPKRVAAAEEESMAALMQEMLGDELKDLLADFGEEAGEIAEETGAMVENSVTSGDAFIASTVAKESRMAAEALGSNAARLAEIHIKNHRQLMNMQFKSLERQTNLIGQGFNNVTQGFNSIIEFNNQVMLTHVKNSQQYYEIMTKLTTENNAILKEMVEMKRNLYSKNMMTPPEEAMDAFKTPFDKNGVFSLKDYLDIVKSNAQDTFIGQAGMMVAMLPSLIAGFVANPLHEISKQGIKAALGPHLREAMRNFDSSLSGIIQTGLAKLFDRGNRNGAGLIESELGKLFGIKAESVEARSSNIMNMMKGPRQWDAEDHIALTKVITSHLSNIEAALTGGDPRIFNYSNGKFTTTTAMKREHRMMEQTIADQNTYELQNLIKNMIYRQAQIDPKKDKQNVEAISNMVRDWALGVQKTGFIGRNTERGQRLGREVRENKNNIYGITQVADNASDDLKRQAKQTKNMLDIIADILDSAYENPEIMHMIFRANGNILNSRAQEAKRRTSGQGLTAAEELIATNSDLSSSKLNIEALLKEKLQEAYMFGDLDRQRDYEERLKNLGWEGTNVDLRRGKNGGIVKSPLAGMDNTITGWQSKIYDVLCEIRDQGLGLGKFIPKFGRNKRSKQKGKAGKQSTGSKTSDGSDSGVDPEDLSGEVRLRFTAQGNPIMDRETEALFAKLYGADFSTDASYNKLSQLLEHQIMNKQFRKGMKKNISTNLEVDRQQRIYYNQNMLAQMMGFGNTPDPRDKSAYHQRVLEATGGQVDGSADFFTQLAKAGSIGAKMGVISANIDQLVNSPRNLMLGIFEQVDSMMYEVMFGRPTGETSEDGKQVKGFFNKMIFEMGKAGETLNKKISEIAESLSDKKGRLWGHFKEFANDWLGWDVEGTVNTVKKYKDHVFGSARSAGKSIFGDIRDAVRGTVDDIRGKSSSDDGNTQGTVPDDVRLVQGHASGYNSGHLAIVSPGEAHIRKDGSVDNIKDTNLRWVNNDDVILNAKQNPLNPDRRSADIGKNLSMENQFRQKLGRSNKIFNYGIGNVADLAADKMKEILNPENVMLHLNKVLELLESVGMEREDAIGFIAEYLGQGLGAATEKLGADINSDVISHWITDAWESDDVRRSGEFKLLLMKSLREAGYKGDFANEKEFRYKDFNKKEGVMNGIKQFAFQAGGTDPEAAMEETKKYIIHNTPELMKGAGAGALIGTVLPLGGPLFGAMAGATVSVLSKNKTFMNWVFGEEFVNENGEVDRKDNGLISKSFMKTLGQYAPDAKKYGIAGTMAGMILPFGPLGGLMGGIAASYIKNNTVAHEFFFGKEGGILNEDRKQRIKKAFPNIAAATLSTLLLGPFGLMGNAVLGAGLGILSTTDYFKNMMLGRKDKKGIRHGGLAGAIRRHITNPLKATMKEMQKDFKVWFREDVTKPFGRGMKPILREIRNQFKEAGDTIMTALEGAFARPGTFSEKVFDKLKWVRKAGGWGKAITKFVVGNTAEGIAKGIGKIGDRIQSRQLDNLEWEGSAQEALDAYKDTNTTNAKSESFFKELTNMSDQELASMSKLLKNINYIRDPRRQVEMDRRKSETINNLMSIISRITEDEKMVDMDPDTHGKLIDLASRLNNMKDTSEIVDIGKDLTKITENAGMKMKDRKDLRDAVNEAHEFMTDYNELTKMRKDASKTNSIKDNLKMINNRFFGGRRDLDFLYEKAGNMSDIMANQLLIRQDQLNKDIAAADREGTLPDEQSIHNETVEAADMQKLVYLEKQSNSLELIANLMMGSDPNQIEKLLLNNQNLEKTLHSFESERKRGKLFRWKSDKDATAARKKEVDRLTDMAVALNADETLNGVDLDAFEEMVNHDKDYKFTKSMIALHKAYEAGNTAMIKDVNEILEIDGSGELMSRVTDLTLFGMTVDPSQYATIYKLTPNQFECAKKLVSMRVVIDDFSMFEKITDPDMARKLQELAQGYS